MGCCFSKKRKKHPDGSAAHLPGRYRPEDRDPPSPEEEKVKEVLSETPSAKPAADPKPVANAVAVEEQEVVLKVKASGDAAASDLGSCLSLATDERSEAASESSVATSSVAGPERSPGKPAVRRRPVSGELARRDRAGPVAAYGVRSRSCRASPSPPPRREPARDRSVRRSPSPAAKRPPTTEQHRPASPAAPLQRKPPVPSRRASPHRARDAPPPPPPPPPPLSPPPQPEEDAVAEDRVAEDNASGNGQGHGDSDGEGKESLENPLVSMECFIFL
ncbi:uncharacterized protein [Lolium perenne]|uniref:uncharacterized protein n=1 Tax=Lolium perenne TaxID=4522 RepID=UPI0021EACE50|nr:formin-like protein 16 [Lolium perenne]